MSAPFNLRQPSAGMTFGHAEPADPRILSKAQVRELLQLLHPDKYAGGNPELALRWFQFFKDYDAR